MTNGFVTEEAARDVSGIVLREDAKTDKMVVDEVATAAARKVLREARRAKAVPVADWLKDEAKRVAAKDFVYEVRRMYENSMKLSPRFAGEFRAFWKLPKDFTFTEKKVRRISASISPPKQGAHTS